MSHELLFTDQNFDYFYAMQTHIQPSIYSNSNIMLGGPVDKRNPKPLGKKQKTKEYIRDEFNRVAFLNLSKFRFI